MLASRFSRGELADGPLAVRVDLGELGDPGMHLGERHPVAESSRERVSPPVRSSPDSSQSISTGPLSELRDHVLPEVLDRLHDLVVLELAELHVTDDRVTADVLVASELFEALLRVTDDDHVLVVEELRVDL